MYISVVREIDERVKFLEEMHSFGGNYSRKYEAQVRGEIADKARELEKLKRDLEPSYDDA